jgi:hypothetical protein
MSYDDLEPGCHLNRVIYDRAMFKQLEERDKSEIARRINAFRLGLVDKYLDRSDVILDIGIGAGTFMNLRGNCLGFDINPHAIKWLEKRKRFFNPYKDSFENGRVRGVTFWDALEHIARPDLMIERMTDQIIFVSLPIFRDFKHMTGSKHFKPGEHLWNFTRSHLRIYMSAFGYRIVEERRDESDIGREDIWTFVLERKKGNGS